MTKTSRNMFLAAVALFSLGTLFTIPLAVYLILYEIDPVTHFYYDNAHFVNVQNIVILSVTVLLVLFIIKKHPNVVKFNAHRNVSVAISSALLGVAICVSSSYSMLQTFQNAKGASGFLTGLTGFLASIFFFALTYSLLTGRNSDLSILALLPVLWGIINLISTFMSLTQIANISEYVYEVMQMVFAILFLYYNARFIGKNPNGREISGIFAFGLPCALFGLLSSLPPVIAHLINRSRGNSFTISDAVYLLMSIYIIALIISLFKAKNSNNSNDGTEKDFLKSSTSIQDETEN